ncbi:MAG TPA: hypothetical protein VGI39_03235 [Polyangiaceae bacterium]|jgi:hypothetical protein
MDTVLRYRSKAMIEDLAVGECTLHRASGSGAARWWQLWIYALRDTDGQPEYFCVPVNPRGGYLEKGPGGKTWGLVCPGASFYPVDPGTKNWVIGPSINVLGDRDAVAGAHAQASIWHHTPEIVGVPEDEPWANGAVP